MMQRVVRSRAPSSMMMQSMKVQNMFAAQCAAKYFSSSTQIEKSVERLNKVLDKEIDYENNNYQQLEDIEVTCH